METIGLAVTLELPCDHRRPARRAVHGDADEARAGRPAALDVGPERRVAGAGDRRLDTGGCFDAAIEAARIALKYRTPVFLLSDAYLANGSEPWLIPDLETYPEIPVDFADAPNHEGGFLPYLRDAETLARPWAIPGTPGLEHRIGAREGRRDRQRLVRPRQPRPHGADPRAQGRRHRRRHPGADGGRGRRRGVARPQLGRHVRAGGRRRAPRPRRGRQGRARAPELSEPLPATPAMCCADTRRFWFRK